MSKGMNCILGDGKSFCKVSHLIRVLLMSVPRRNGARQDAAGLDRTIAVLECHSNDPVDSVSICAHQGNFKRFVLSFWNVRLRNMHDHYSPQALKIRIS
jgi:hypothetical protein